MRAYSEANEEARLTRDQLKEWRAEGLITPEQFDRMEKDTPCDLRRTNIFLRVVLFVFTVLIVAATIGLFLFAGQMHEDRGVGFVFLVFAAFCYAASELAVTQARFYRYGIEEALAACAVGLLYFGTQLAFSDGDLFSRSKGPDTFLAPALATAASLWIWRRFGLPYAPLAALIFLTFIPACWTPLPMAQRLLLAAFYAMGLVIVILLRPRHRTSYLNSDYSIAEAALWLAGYLALNLQLSSLNVFTHGLVEFPVESLYPKPFYWATWVFCWCLPCVILARGIRSKDRLVMAAGTLSAIVTLITNKPYLGWPRHSWDPMLLGALLVGVAVLLQRWLGAGVAGIRHGFTAQRLSAKDRRLMNVGTAAIGIATPEMVQVQPESGGFKFGGGDSGGGGASSNF